MFVIFVNPRRGNPPPELRTLSLPDIPCPLLDILQAWLLSRGDSVMLTLAYQSRQTFRGHRVNDLLKATLKKVDTVIGLGNYYSRLT